MSKREFNPKSFFRKLHPDVRDRLTGQLGLLPLMAKTKQDGDPEQDKTFFAWSRVPKEKRKVSDRDLVRINDMACDKGRFYLDQAADALWIGSPDALEKARDMSTHDLAATLFIESKQHFDRAYGEFQIDDCQFRAKRKGRSPALPNVQASKKDSMKRRIEKFYHESGRGRRRCQVEDFDDVDRFAVFIYHEHRVRFEDRFDDKDTLVSEERRPVEEATAVFNKHSHILMVKARERALRDEVISLMGELYFGDATFFEDPYAREFDLSVLNAPTFAPIFSPGDGISAVTVGEVTFQHPSADVGQVTVRCPHGHIHALAALGMPLDSVTFEAVKLVIHPDGRNWKHRRTIILRLPDHWNLADTPRDRVLAGYVEKWGFFAQGDDHGDDADDLDDAPGLGELFHARVAARYRGNQPPVGP